MSQKRKLLILVVAIVTIICASVFLVKSILAKDSVVASIMRLKKTQGTVEIADEQANPIPVKEELILHSGYRVGTKQESYAWINLDDTKLTKMDQNSNVSIKQNGRALELDINSGNLFFYVSEPLEQDESFNIRVSNMVTGIRGTCGWVECTDTGQMDVYILEGKVECESPSGNASIPAGTVGHFNSDSVVTRLFAVNDIRQFVMDEIDGNEQLKSKIIEATGFDFSQTEEAQVITLSMPVEPDELRSYLSDPQITAVTVTSNTASVLEMSDLDIPEGKTLNLSENVFLNLVSEDRDKVELSFADPGTCSWQGSLTTVEDVSARVFIDADGDTAIGGNFIFDSIGCLDNEGNLTVGGKLIFTDTNPQSNFGTITTKDGTFFINGDIRRSDLPNGEVAFWNEGTIKGGITVDSGHGGYHASQSGGVADKIVCKQGQIYMATGQTGTVTLDGDDAILIIHTSGRIDKVIENAGDCHIGQGGYVGEFVQEGGSSTVADGTVGNFVHHGGSYNGMQ